MRIPAFWDSSALVPLCIRQSITPRAVVLFKQFQPVVWWTAPVEIASALARLLRMNQLDAASWAQARQLAHRLAASWSMIQPSDILRARSVELIERYDLRAADALHLAAALQWCEEAPHGRAFLTADEELREAALHTGFDVSNL